ncbi:GNAT family N-acetyltransferase [Halobaculum litoreum]|uniref:GNAT family N-acetyltransferase n=1 Tax=Halobaculum litoreum TaxID=3031998 RepID=A0ABD5XS79_9EURY|nr:GNAT family N-acetyltransferase [Halobaculum sp. DT92]
MSDGRDDDGDDGPRIRVARDAEVDAVRRLLDAAMLTVPDGLADRVAGGDVLVAAADAGVGGTDADVVGALVLDGSHVDAVAVRKSRRAAGVGRALVAAAADRTDAPLTATFRRQVRPFYGALGFVIEDRGDGTGRFDGRLDGAPERG